MTRYLKAHQPSNKKQGEGLRARAASAGTRLCLFAVGIGLSLASVAGCQPTEMESRTDEEVVAAVAEREDARAIQAELRDAGCVPELEEGKLVEGLPTRLLPETRIYYSVANCGNRVSFVTATMDSDGQFLSPPLGILISIDADDNATTYIIKHRDEVSFRMTLPDFLAFVRSQVAGSTDTGSTQTFALFRQDTADESVEPPVVADPTPTPTSHYLPNCFECAQYVADRALGVNDHDGEYATADLSDAQKSRAVEAFCAAFDKQVAEEAVAAADSTEETLKEIDETAGTDNEVSDRLDETTGDLVGIATVAANKTLRDNICTPLGRAKDDLRDFLGMDSYPWEVYQPYFVTAVANCSEIGECPVPCNGPANCTPSNFEDDMGEKDIDACNTCLADNNYTCEAGTAGAFEWFKTCHRNGLPHYSTAHHNTDHLASAGIEHTPLDHQDDACWDPSLAE